LLVIRSLFEEQILMDALRLEEELSVGADIFPESLSYFPDLEHGKADEHLMWIEETRKEVKMPLIASLNAVSSGGWTKYAKQLEATGVDGLELNVYAVAADQKVNGAVLEAQLYEIVEAVIAEVDIPVAVKISPFYTSIANVVSEVDKRGAKAVVLFNRFLQPDIDPKTETLVSEMVYSSPEELKLPLRWVALLYGRVKTDVQTASALHTQGVPYISTMLRELEGWMDEHDYKNLDDFRGKMSQRETDDPFAFERAQYVKLLLGQQ